MAQLVVECSVTLLAESGVRLGNGWWIVVQLVSVTMTYIDLCLFFYVIIGKGRMGPTQWNNGLEIMKIMAIIRSWYCLPPIVIDAKSTWNDNNTQGALCNGGVGVGSRGG